MKIDVYVHHVAVEPKQADRSRIVLPKGTVLPEDPKRPGHEAKPWIQHYQPAVVTNNQKALSEAIARHRPPVAIDTAAAADIVFKFAWPASAPQWMRKFGWWPRFTKPDNENLSKQLCDVLQAVGYVTNDSRLWDVRLRKIWTHQDGVDIHIRTTDTLKSAAGETRQIDGTVVEQHRQMAFA